MLETARLILNGLNDDDTSFIIALVNSPGWLRFIGERHVKTEAEAAVYIAKIRANENIDYRVARSKENGRPVGIVSFIKRDYLEYPDIGFALSPGECGKGYAFEATKAVLNNLVNSGKHRRILAIAAKANERSVKLLQNLGLQFEKELLIGGESLLMYGLDIRAGKNI